MLLRAVDRLRATAGVVCTLLATTKVPASEIYVDRFVLDNCTVK